MVIEIVGWIAALGICSLACYVWWEHYTFWKKAGFYKKWTDIFTGGKSG